MSKLVNIIRNTLTASIIAAPLFLGSCQKEYYEEENFAPEASLNINPVSGEAPLIININTAWSDLNGDSDIKTYKMNIDKRNVGNDTTITSQTPIPTITRTLKDPGTYDISFEITDSQGVSDKEITSVEVYPKDNRITIDLIRSTSPYGAKYNSQKDKAGRDNIIQTGLDGDWVNIIPPSLNPLWVCGHYAEQLMTNSQYWGKDIRLDDDYFNYFDDRLYNWYMGKNIDSIKINQGTLADMGKLGIPMGIATIIDTTYDGKGSYPIDGIWKRKNLMDSKGYFGHAINWVLTGKDIKNWKDITFIEPQEDKINIPIGGWNIPRDCDEVTLNYYYPYMEGGRNYLRWVSLAKFRIKDGTPILTWENKDPHYRFITQREE